MSHFVTFLLSHNQFFDTAQPLMIYSCDQLNNEIN